MSWKRKRIHTGKNKNYNLSRKLRQEGRTNETFEITLAKLTLKYACSATKTKGEAMRFLGLRPKDYKNLSKKYNIESYFEEST